MTKPPRLVVKWRSRVDESSYWAYKPQQYAKPFFLGRNDELIVAASNGGVSRRRAGNGQVVWQRYLEDPQSGEPAAVHADPLVVEDMVYVGSLDGGVHALGLDGGEVAWRYQCEDAIEGEVSYAQGRLFVIDAKEVLYALDAQTGKLLWRYQRPVPEFFTVKGASGATVSEGVVYAGFADGSLAGLDLDTGKEVWVVDLSNEETEFVDVDTDVVATASGVYAASYAGGVFGLDRTSGGVMWRAPVEGVTTMVHEGGVLFVGSAQGKVVAIDALSRQFLWQVKLKEHVPVELELVGPYLFVSTSSGPLMVFDALGGVPMVKWRPSHGFNAGVVFDKGRGFTLSNGGYLYAFELAF